MNKLQLLVAKAKKYVGKVDPYLASILYQTPVFGLENMKGIGSTNGLRINVNSRYFLDSGDVSVLAFVLAHEAKHIDLRSMLREKGRNHEIWNEATDYAINVLLMRQIQSKSSLIEWMRAPTVGPDGSKIQILLNYEYEWATAEEIYDILISKERMEGSCGGSQKDSGDNSQGDGAESSQELDDGGGKKEDLGKPYAFDPETGLDGEVGEDAVSKRIEAVKMSAIGDAKEKSVRSSYGKQAGGHEENMVYARSCQLDWRMAIRRSMGRLGSFKQDLARPSRRTIAYRSLGRKFYFPKMRRQSQNRIMVVVDTSMSVSHDSLRMFLGEVSNCLRVLRGTTLRLYCCDTNLKFVGEYKGSLPAELELSGWGGTSFEPAFRELRKLESEGKKMQLLVYFTDGCCLYPELDKGEPKCEVLWCLDNENQPDAPFGSTARINPK